MDLYVPPGSQQEPPRPSPSSDLDVAAAATPSIVRVAGGMSLLAGIITALTAVQALSMVRISGFMSVAPWVLITLGLTVAVVGGQLMRARAWAAMTAIALTATLFVFTGAWLVWSFSQGFVSLFALGSPFLALIALGFAIASIGPNRRAAEARARLTAEGLDLGL